jgi:hypothetical protein
VSYDEVTSAFFRPSPPGTAVAVTQAASPARRLRDAIEPIAMHSVWSRTTHERLARHGLDFLGTYVACRAAVLGDADAGVVVSSFAVFEPGFLTATYEAARQRCPRDRLLAERDEATVVSLSAVLDGEDVASAADALAAAVDRADGTGRPLFSGLRSLPWPPGPVGRLWRACELLREHRGDSHVAACIAVGLGPVEMNVLTELWLGMPLGVYTATRGWSEGQVSAAVEGLVGRGLVEGDALTAAGTALRDGIEATTDGMQRPVVDALGERLDGLVERLDRWSQRCIEAGAFPPDVHKRAAG